MKLALGRGATAAFIVTLIVLLASSALSYRSIRRLAQNERLVVHTHEVLDYLQETLTTLVDAETGQRGYIITGDASYLEPYRSALASVKDGIERLKIITLDNEVQRERLTVLQRLVEERLRWFQFGIDRRDAEGFEGARQFVLTGKGKREMDVIRKEVAGMKQVERELLALREQESRLSYRSAVFTVLISGLLGLVVMGSAYALAVREVVARHEGAEALRKANEELEMRVEQRTSALAATNEALQRSNRELEQFASVASHDLQEPLRKIQAFGDRLLIRNSAELGEQGRDYLDRMLSSAARMRSLIDALLSFARVTTKAQPFVPVDLGVIAGNVMSDLESLTQRSGGSVEVGELPTLEADAQQMRQLIQNLIANGLKFSRPEVPPRVQVTSRLLDAAEVAGEAIPRCEISVADNGIGFEETYLDRIFELFQRLHGRQEYEGTGMGLAICRKIVQRHGGEITARSTPGSGATFLVTLPLRQPQKNL